MLKQQYRQDDNMEILVNHSKNKIGISRIFKVSLESYQDGSACSNQGCNQGKFLGVKIPRSKI